MYGTYILSYENVEQGKMYLIIIEIVVIFITGYGLSQSIKSNHEKVIVIVIVIIFITSMGYHYQKRAIMK